MRLKVFCCWMKLCRNDAVMMSKCPIYRLCVDKKTINMLLVSEKVVLLQPR